MKEWNKIKLILLGKDFRERCINMLKENVPEFNLSTPHAQLGYNTDIFLYITKDNYSPFSKEEFFKVYEIVVKASQGMEYSIYPSVEQFFGIEPKNNFEGR